MNRDRDRGAVTVTVTVDRDGLGGDLQRLLQWSSVAGASTPDPLSLVPPGAQGTQKPGAEQAGWVPFATGGMARR